MNKCKKCGHWMDYSFRYCPSCSAPAYTSLEPENATPDSFPDLFNSLYNLLADRSNSKRSQYLPSSSEQVITRRCKIEFDDEYGGMVRNLVAKFIPPTAAENLYHLYLTNTLTGYTYRSIEEIISKRKSPPLSESDKEYFMRSLFSEAGDDLKQSGYKVLDPGDHLDNRVLFCLAIRWGNRHLKFQLVDDKFQDKWGETILSQNISLGMEHHESIFRLLFPGADAKSMAAKKHSEIADGTQQDFLFGYIVKLAESLVPA